MKNEKSHEIRKSMSKGQLMKMQPYLKGINRNCRLKLDYEKNAYLRS